MNLNSVPTPHLSLPRMGAMERNRTEKAWRRGQGRGRNTLALGNPVSECSVCEHWLLYITYRQDARGASVFLLPGRRKILESHGGFEGRQIVAADREDETVGGFHGKATPLRGKNPLDMVFIDQGCTVDAQKDRWIQTLLLLL